jgi:hypothetical protein
MDTHTFVSGLIAGLLFYTFVPGVAPKGGNKVVLILAHAFGFAVAITLIRMLLSSMTERMTNYGPVCPNGYVESTNQGGKKDCVPSGHQTYPVNTGVSSNIPMPMGK